MAGALAKFAQAGGLEISDKDAAAALRKSAADGQTGDGSGVDFLSFSGKKGAYSLGRDHDDVDPEDRFIVEPFATTRGWVCWKGGKAVKKHEWSVYAPGKGVLEKDLEDYGPYNEKGGEGWQQSMGLGMVATHDPEKSIRFTINSISGRNVFSSLIDEIATQMENGDAPIPIIGLDSEEFESHGQTNSKPILRVEHWVTRAEVEGYIADEDGSLSDLLQGSYGTPSDAVEEKEPEKKKKRSRKQAA